MSAPEPEVPEAPPQSTLANVIERNIQTITRLRLRALRTRSPQDRLADGITAFSGRMLFAYVHVIWFGLWFVLNSGHVGIAPFDPFPYGLLTMVVSLEAIFLATFVLVSQNRISAEADRRADLDLQIGLLTEHEITRGLVMLDAIQKKLGIESASDADLLELELDTKPEDVLAEIDRIAQRAHRPRKKED